MSDLFGYATPATPFRDIRNTRDSVAEEKAILAKQLGDLVFKVPPSINSAGVEAVRAWKHHQANSLKILKSPRSTRTDLITAIAQMRAYL